MLNLSYHTIRQLDEISTKNNNIYAKNEDKNSSPMHAKFSLPRFVYRHGVLGTYEARHGAPSGGHDMPGVQCSRHDVPRSRHIAPRE